MSKESVAALNCYIECSRQAGHCYSAASQNKWSSFLLLMCHRETNSATGKHNILVSQWSLLAQVLQMTLAMFYAVKDPEDWVGKAAKEVEAKSL